MSKGGAAQAGRPLSRLPKGAMDLRRRVGARFDRPVLGPLPESHKAGGQRNERARRDRGRHGEQDAAAPAREQLSCETRRERAWISPKAGSFSRAAPATALSERLAPRRKDMSIRAPSTGAGAAIGTLSSSAGRGSLTRRSRLGCVASSDTDQRCVPPRVELGCWCRARVESCGQRPDTPRAVR